MLRIQKNLSSFSHVSTRRLVVSLVTALSGLVVSQSAHAQVITVATPIAGTTVTSPLPVRAHNVGCSGLTPTSFGYTIDSSSTFIRGTVNDIDVATQTLSSGTHTIHFKSWTSAGMCPRVDDTFVVGTATPSTTPGSSSIPSTALISANLDAATNWKGEHDSGTPGTSQGSMVYPASTPVYDDAREFYMTYTSHGGERWHVSYGMDGVSAHFALDTYVYFKDSTQVQNLELDLNQVMSNGETVIFGTQCSSVSNTWEYSYASGGHPHWHASNVPCNPKTWASNTWHHIQIGLHRDSSGNATHDWVDLDGTHNVFVGASGPAGEWLGWAKNDLLVNFQIDGASSGSGTVTSYIHKMQIYSW